MSILIWNLQMAGRSQAKARFLRRMGNLLNVIAQVLRVAIRRSPLKIKGIACFVLKEGGVLLLQGTFVFLGST